jgi:hypothetical protein
MCKKRNQTILNFIFFAGNVPCQGAVESSLFISYLCKDLENLSPYMDLLKILTQVSRRMPVDYDDDDDPNLTVDTRLQVPHVHSTLTRDIYFHPKQLRNE